MQERIRPIQLEIWAEEKDRTYKRQELVTKELNRIFYGNDAKRMEDHDNPWSLTLAHLKLKHTSISPSYNAALNIAKHVRQLIALQDLGKHTLFKNIQKINSHFLTILTEQQRRLENQKIDPDYKESKYNDLAKNDLENITRLEKRLVNLSTDIAKLDAVAEKDPKRAESNVALISLRSDFANIKHLLEQRQKIFSFKNKLNNLKNKIEASLNLAEINFNEVLRLIEQYKNILTQVEQNPTVRDTENLNLLSFSFASDEELTQQLTVYVQEKVKHEIEYQNGKKSFLTALVSDTAYFVMLRTHASNILAHVIHVKNKELKKISSIKHRVLAIYDAISALHPEKEEDKQCVIQAIKDYITNVEAKSESSSTEKYAHFNYPPDIQIEYSRLVEFVPMPTKEIINEYLTQLIATKLGTLPSTVEDRALSIFDAIPALKVSDVDKWQLILDSINNYLNNGSFQHPFIYLIDIKNKPANEPSERTVISSPCTPSLTALNTLTPSVSSIKPPNISPLGLTPTYSFATESKAYISGFETAWYLANNSSMDKNIKISSYAEFYQAGFAAAQSQVNRDATLPIQNVGTKAAAAFRLYRAKDFASKNAQKQVNHEHNGIIKDYAELLVLVKLKETKLELADEKDIVQVYFSQFASAHKQFKSLVVKYEKPINLFKKEHSNDWMGIEEIAEKNGKIYFSSLKRQSMTTTSRIATSLAHRVKRSNTSHDFRHLLSLPGMLVISAEGSEPSARSSRGSPVPSLESFSRTSTANSTSVPSLDQQILLSSRGANPSNLPSPASETFPTVRMGFTRSTEKT